MFINNIKLIFNAFCLYILNLCGNKKTITITYLNVWPIKLDSCNYIAKHQNIILNIIPYFLTSCNTDIN